MQSPLETLKNGQALSGKAGKGRRTNQGVSNKRSATSKSGKKGKSNKSKPSQKPASKTSNVVAHEAGAGKEQGSPGVIELAAPKAKASLSDTSSSSSKSTPIQQRQNGAEIVSKEERLRKSEGRLLPKIAVSSLKILTFQQINTSNRQHAICTPS